MQYQYVNVNTNMSSYRFLWNISCRQVIQLFETLVVRHGVMLVGPTGGGKTTVHQILAKTLTMLHRQRDKSSPHYKRVMT